MTVTDTMGPAELVRKYLESPACRASPAGPPEPRPARCLSAREATVSEFEGCRQRFLGMQGSESCNLFARPIGAGGPALIVTSRSPWPPHG